LRSNHFCATILNSSSIYIPYSDDWFFLLLSPQLLLKRVIENGDLIYSLRAEENIKKRMSVKNLLAVDWNSNPLGVQLTEGGETL
jgi:hypothetical protein